MIVERVEEAKALNSIHFELLNGLAILPGNELVAVDGGSNSVCVISENHRLKKRIGGLGYGRYAFREPVGVFVIDDDRIFVTDWHNHRVVEYDKDLKYVAEIGYASRYSFGREEKPVFRHYLSYLLNKGSYIQSHFNVDGARAYTGEKRGKSLLIALKVLRYYANVSGGFSSGFKRFRDPPEVTSKPNGVCSIGNQLFVTQKNTKSVSVYEKTTSNYALKGALYGPTDEIKFGRLGNVFAYKSCLYICDEQMGVVWELEWPSRKVRKIIGDCSGIDRFAPFSACVIGNEFIAVCGGFNIQIFNLKSLALVDKSHNIGELHAIAYSDSKNRIYVADRGVGKIRVFHWDFNGNE